MGFLNIGYELEMGLPEIDNTRFAIWQTSELANLPNGFCEEAKKAPVCFDKSL